MRFLSCGDTNLVSLAMLAGSVGNADQKTSRTVVPNLGSSYVPGLQLPEMASTAGEDVWKL